MDTSIVATRILQALNPRPVEDVSELTGTISRTSAFGLAASYHGFLEALYKHDRNGVIVWGSILVKDQERTGIQMLKPSTINDMVKQWRGQ